MERSYVRRVAFQLRQRGASEEVVRGELARLAALEESLTAGDVMPPPAHVAEAFPRQRQRGASRILIWCACVVVVAGVAVQVLGFLISTNQPRLGPVPLFTGALPIMVILLVCAGLVDYRLPRSIKGACRRDVLG